MTPSDDMTRLARGGRTNILGFLLRLMARLPFLFIAARVYGPEVVGRFASASLAIESAALVATLGLKRGLAQALATGAETGRPESHIVWDALLVAFLAGLLAAAILFVFPVIMFPNSRIDGLDRLLGLAVIPSACADVALAALAYRDNVRAAVTARAVLEPWTISIAAWLFAFSSRDGLLFAYLLSMAVALGASLVPFLRSYGLPRGWSPHISAIVALARRNAPLAGADANEWLTRNIDRFIIGLLFSPGVVGVYYMAQQVVSLPQKLKTSFDPVLGPGITRCLARNDRAGIAQQVRQVSFWIIVAQAALAIAMGVNAHSVMEVVGGPRFGVGTAALAILLTAEVLASTGAICEAGLVYIARHRNLAISVTMLGVQVVLSYALVLLARRAGYPLNLLFWQAAGPPLATMITLTLSSVIKARLLSRLLDAQVAELRWSFVVAVLASVAVGGIFLLVPHRYQWVRLTIGIPILLAVYFTIILKWAFRPEDRTLLGRLPGTPAQAGDG